MDSHNSALNEPTTNSSSSAVGVQSWMVNRMAEELRVDRDLIKADQPIMSLGIDSVQLVTILTQLEDWAGVRFDGNPLEQYSTIDELAAHVEKLRHQRTISINS
jgi:acyl carrier protein